MSELKLLPCPFCGGKAEYEEDWDANYSNQVACTQCPAAVQVTRGDFTSWNRRASPVVGDDGLPPLPEPDADLLGDGEYPVWNKAQVEQAQRDAIAPYAERIRQLELELAERKTASIGDDAEFERLLFIWMGLRRHYQYEEAEPIKSAWRALIAYIDGRTAGAAPQSSDGLSDAERAFVELVKANPGCKLNGGEALGPDGEALWKKPEELGLIECVGSYKWRVKEEA